MQLVLPHAVSCLYLTASPAPLLRIHDEQTASCSLAHEGLLAQLLCTETVVARAARRKTH